MDFIRTNYHIVIWGLVGIGVLLIFGLLVWWIVKKKKKRKELSEILKKTRKETILEIIEGGEDLDEEETAELFDISEKEAHKHLIELVKEKKIVLDNDIGQQPRYKSKNKNNK